MKPNNTTKNEGMPSLMSLYRIGCGPSSSHSIGPQRAARRFLRRCPDAEKYRCVFCGSLAQTGRGHRSDAAVKSVFAPKVCEVVFDKKRKDLPHVNTMIFSAYRKGREIDRAVALSVGGGSIVFDGAGDDEKSVYPEANWRELAISCERLRLDPGEYVFYREGPPIGDYLKRIRTAMFAAAERGLNKEGILPGGLMTERRAKKLLSLKGHEVAAYAFAVAEENAAGGVVVTAPTCGSAGVLAAVLYEGEQKRAWGEEETVRALAAAGLVGNVIKKNGSVSGAECGCMAEIGSACAMAAAALAFLKGGDPDIIETAAEIALEHHLGLTCDPVGGLVQIPCIERNGVAAETAKSAAALAFAVASSRKVSLDQVIAVMKATGADLKAGYRETAAAGLAAFQDVAQHPLHGESPSIRPCP